MVPDIEFSEQTQMPSGFDYFEATTTSAVWLCLPKLAAGAWSAKEMVQGYTEGNSEGISC